MNQKNKNYLIIILVVFFILLFGFFILKEKNNSVNVNNIKEVRKQEIKKHLTGSEFLETYKNSSDAILVDIRTKEEFDSGNISGSINVDFYDKDFISNIKSLGQDKNLFIYCRSGNRTGETISILEKEGIIVYDLVGGISLNGNLINK